VSALKLSINFVCLTSIILSTVLPEDVTFVQKHVGDRHLCLYIINILNLVVEKTEFVDLESSRNGKL
jgi:hypothetical protein